MRLPDYRPLVLVLAASTLLALKPQGDEPRISVKVAKAEVQDVLRLLADVGGQNIVISEAVRGQVTLQLNNVPWRDALHVVLDSHRLGAIEREGVIFVDTLERLTAHDEARATRARARARAAPLVTRIIPVRYARAQDLVPIVASMLGAHGTVVADPRTNVLVVTESLDRMRRIVARVSAP